MLWLIPTRGEPSGQATQAPGACPIYFITICPFNSVQTFHILIILKEFSIHLFVFYELTYYRRWVWTFGAEECCPLLCKLKTPQLADHREQKLSFVLRTRVGEWGSKPDSSKCSRRSYSFQPEYWRSFSNSKRKFLFFDIKRVAGIIVLQTLQWI